MLPNKRVAILLFALLTLPVVMPSASADQHENNDSPEGSDLVVAGFEGIDNRVVEVPQDLTVIIRNQGKSEYRTTTGWQVFVGFNALSDSACIQKSQTSSQTPNLAEPCYVRFDATDAERKVMDPGEEVRVKINWTAKRSQWSETIDSTRLFIEIASYNPTRPAGTADVTSKGSACAGDDHCGNNVASFPVFVKLPGVRAVPERENAPTPGSTVNTPWTFPDIVEACPVAPGIIPGGCKAKPGTILYASYSVRNTGNAQDSFTVDFVGVNSLIKKGYRFAVEPSVLTLGKYNSLDGDDVGRAIVQIVVPENATYHSTINVNQTAQFVRWKSTLNPSITTATADNPGCGDASAQGLCQNPSLPSLVIGAKYKFNASTNETARLFQPGIVGQFNITINNTGNAEDAYNVSFVPERSTVEPSAWNITVRQPPRLKAGEKDNATVLVTPGSNVTKGSYRVVARVQSLSDPEAPLKEFAFRVDVDQRFGIAGAGGLPALLVPGEVATFNLRFTNTGNGMDNVTLDLQSSVPGWNARLSNTSLQLQPSQTATVKLTATVPPNTPEDTRAHFYVNATSQGPRDVAFEQRARSQMITSTVTVKRGPNIQLDAPVNTSFIDPGKTTSFDIFVTNTGNVADNFTVDLSLQDPAWAVTAQPEHLVLAPLQQGLIKVTLRAPGASLVGETTRAFATVKSTVDPGRAAQTSLEGRISGPDLYVESVLVNATNPYSGDPLEVSIAYGNRGNKAPTDNVTLGLYFVQGGIETILEERLIPGNELAAQLRTGIRVTWDTADKQGAGVLVARIDTLDRILEIDDTKTSNEATTPITLRTFDIRVTAPEGLSARPGQRVDYTESPQVFLVEYRGNQPNEPVTIRLESAHGWLQGEPELQLALPRGTPLPVQASLIVPALPGVGEDTLRITVIPTLRPGSALTASTTTKVLDDVAPEIRGITVTPQEAKLGEELTIEAIVVDATGLSTVTAYVTSPGNETTAIPLALKGGHVWSATKEFKAVGRYKVAIEATDASGKANLNRSRTLAAEFLVQPSSAPVIKLAANQSETIRTGSLVPFVITDPLGIAKASYSIKGVQYDLAKPRFEMDTSGFQPGKVDVTVRAENLFGVVSTAQFQFTVDNTQPSISGVEMVPPRPKANEEVTLKIRTDLDVDAVDVAVKRNGQLLETRSATRVGAGSFEFTFNPPEGEYSVDVTARDPAGNQKLNEGAVVFSAKPASPFGVPGPGAAVMALAAVAVALALGRRRRG